ncbi:unnamed protein product [Caenorhabditis brenneri]
MEEEHGEDPIVDPEELAAEDFAIQGLLLNQAAPRHQPAVWHRQMDDSSDDESDDDADDGWGIRVEDVEQREADRKMQDRFLMRQEERARRVMARLRARNH